jgi:hypothetical protein
MNKVKNGHINNLRYIVLFGVIAFGLIAIVGSGGGGGGGGGGGDGGGGITYTGITSQATIDETNAVDLATGAYYGGNFGTTMALGAIQTEEDRQISRPRTLIVSQALNKCIDLVNFTSASSSTFYGSTYTETIYGTCGGSGTISIDVNDVTGDFTGSLNFNNYCENGVTISGSTSFSGVIDVNTGDLLKFSFSFDNLSFNDGSDSFTIDGNISYNYTTYPVTISMDILMRDDSTGKVFWSHNYFLSITGGANYIDFYILGRYYDPDYGYVDSESTADFRIYDGDVWPSQGVLIVEGNTGRLGGSTTARFTGYACGACVVDADTEGGGSYDWSSGFLNMYFDEVNPPEAPYNLDPTNNEIVFGTNPTLSWLAGARSCGFDVYLDIDNPPLTLVSSKQFETTFQPSGLVSSTIYYWKVVAWNTIGSNTSDVRSFKTGVTTTLSGSYDTPGNARGIYVDGSYAYVADGYSGLQIVDISDPSSPSLAGSYDTLEAGYVFINGSYAYVSINVDGLQIVDISDPSNPSLAGSYDTPGNANGIYVDGSYAYVVGHAGGLQIVDISNPSNPSLAGSYGTGDAFNVFISGSYAYVASGWDGLQIIDISNPSSPSFVGSYITSDIARGVHIIGTYAYVRDDSALLVIDISDPSSPSLAGSYASPEYASDIFVEGSYAYLADRDDHLQIVDISDPSSPSLAGSYDTPGDALGIYVDGSYAYVAASSSGLQVIRVGN